MKKSGIYRITNTVTGQHYVGQSVDLVSRLAHHKCDLKSGRSHNDHMQSSFNKYGLDSFEFVIIEECLKKHLDKKERYHIKNLNSIKSGFNKESGGNLKKKLSDCTKEKLRQANLGKTSPMKGKVFTSLIGRIKGKQERKNISKALMGHKLSEETKEKIRQKSIGRPSGNRRSVVDIKTGSLWPSVNHAAKDLGYNYTLLSCMLSGSRKNKTNLRYA